MFYVLHKLANVHDLYNQARMEKHGAFQLLIGLIIVVVVGAFNKIYFEGPSCPSSAKLTGTFFLMMHISKHQFSLSTDVFFLAMTGHGSDHRAGEIIFFSF